MDGEGPSASRTVLSTYELLENVLLQLPSIDLTVVMRVSKSWHSIVTRSSAIHDARILAPIEKTHPQLDPRTEPIDKTAPLYSSDSKITFHSVFAWGRLSTYTLDPSTDSQHPTLKRSIAEYHPYNSVYNDHLQAVADEFATKPPCQAILLRKYRLKGHGAEPEAIAVVYVRDGVRVSHLQEAYGGMVNTFMKLLGDSRYTPKGCVLSFETVDLGGEF